MPQHATPIVKDDGFGNSITMRASGQIAAYKDSEWIGFVTLKDTMNHRDMAQALIESQVNEGHIFEKGNNRPFHRPYFEVLRQRDTQPNIWDFNVHRVYLD